jgi:hypothetical protein
VSSDMQCQSTAVNAQVRHLHALHDFCVQPPRASSCATCTTLLIGTLSPQHKRARDTLLTQRTLGTPKPPCATRNEGDIVSSTLLMQCTQYG